MVALLAGKYPAKTPTIAEKLRPEIANQIYIENRLVDSSPIMLGSIDDKNKLFNKLESPSDINNPNIPPNNPMKTDLKRNIDLISPIDTPITFIARFLPVFD